MRSALDLMEQVDRYIDGTMDPNERDAFQDRLNNEADLRELLLDQQRLRSAARRSPVRRAAKQAHARHQLSKWATAVGTTIAVIITITGAVYLWKDQAEPMTEDADQRLDELHALLSDTTGIGIEPFVIIVDPKKDTTILTPSGIMLDVPKGAFRDGLGKPITTAVRITLVEALDAVSILKAGLSTMSGDTLLETGVMFYFDAQANGKPVVIDRQLPITAMVPADATRDGMQLYQGVKLDDGRIDWRNPLPMKRTLVPADMNTLDFYPPGFVARVAELGYDITNKAFLDSLYLSFSGEAEAIRSANTRLAEADSTSMDPGNVNARGIDPASVMAIWDPRFNNTNLATSAFEERMRAIHGTCDNSVLDLYVDNLDKDLSTIDALAASKGYTEFNALARRRDGRIDLPAHAADRLAKQYRKWSQAGSEAARRTRSRYWKEQNEKEQEASERKVRQANASIEREIELFSKEYDVNLNKVCEELGMTVPTKHRDRPATAWVVEITFSAWRNIDQVAQEATRTRSRVKIENPRSGIRKDVIGYRDLSVKVKDRATYNELMVYMLPKGLNSFQRMWPQGDRFEERLNKLLTYDVFAIGMQGQVQCVGRVEQVEPGTVEVVLHPVNDNGLHAMLKDNGCDVELGLLNEGRYYQWLALDNARREQNAEWISLTNAVREVVLPCWNANSVWSGGTNSRILADRGARFPGGNKALRKYLTRSLRNSDDALRRYIEGRVEVTFWVMKDGTVKDPVVTRQLYPLHDSFAKKLFLDMPTWDPSIRNGRPVSLQYAQDVWFVDGDAPMPIYSEAEPKPVGQR
ncbi:MAG: hypothetical protein IPN38_15155 [Flavobacteriales bacterium]|nr:hypothetical protein [Flavobacteriales bacterium]